MCVSRCKKYSKIFYSLPLLVDIFSIFLQYFVRYFLQYFTTLFHLDWPAHSINWATEVCSDEQQPGEHQEVVQTGEEEELFEVDREEDAEDKHPGDGDGEEGAETFRWGWEVSKATGRQLLSEWTEASLSPPTYSPENILIILIFIVIIIVFIAIIVIIGVYNDLPESALLNSQLAAVSVFCQPENISVKSSNHQIMYIITIIINIIIRDAWMKRRRP